MVRPQYLSAGLRLTRRGRTVLAAAMILALVAIVTVLRTSAAGGSEPSGRGGPLGRRTRA